ncbi:hypothetical protein AKJ16_DCAP26798 [Drosera capensis]
MAYLYNDQVLITGSSWSLAFISISKSQAVSRIRSSGPVNRNAGRMEQRNPDTNTFRLATHKLLYCCNALPLLEADFAINVFQIIERGVVVDIRFVASAMLVALAHRLGMGLHRSDLSLRRLFIVNRSIRNRSSGRCRVRGAGPEGRVVRGSFGSGRIGRMGDLRQRNLGVIKYLRNQFKEERLESMGIRVAFYTLMKSSFELHGLQLDVVKSYHCFHPYHPSAHLLFCWMWLDKLWNIVVARANAEGVEKFIVFPVVISGFSMSGFCFVRWRQSSRRSKNFPWQHDLIEESLAAAGITRSETDAKLFVSNMDSRVSNDGIRVQIHPLALIWRHFAPRTVKPEAKAKSWGIRSCFLRLES